MNLYHFLEKSLLAFPDKTAIISADKQITYRELDHTAGQIAANLSTRGLPAGSVIGILAHNSIAQHQVILGGLRVNCCCSCLNWRLTADELAHLLSYSSTGYLLFDDQTAALANDIKNLQPGIICEHINDIISQSVTLSEFDIVDALSTDTAIMYFTSGTTGIPKGVMLTHSGLSSYVLSFAHASTWGPDVIYQTAAPMFHISGFSALVCLLTGGTLVLHDSFRGEAFLESISTHRPNRVSLLPTTIQRLLNVPTLHQYDVSSVKKLVYGGAPISPQLMEQALHILPCTLEQAYGMTETGTLCILAHADHLAKSSDPRKNRRLSVGKPLAGVGIRVMDDSGHCLPAFSIGEIIVHTPSLFKGYCRNSEETSAKIRGGWYYTGDIGYLDDDGYLYVLDRKNDMIISGGENIYPKEVERVIQEMGVQISQVAVVGRTDPEWGNVVTAFIVKEPDSSVSAEEIIAWCSKKLAKYKCPRRVIFMDELPMNASGKILKNELKTIRISDSVANSDH